MAKRHHCIKVFVFEPTIEGSAGAFSGFYNSRKEYVPPLQALRHANETNLSCLSAVAANYFWATCSTINGSYVAIVTVFLIVLLSFVLPDISQKIQRTNELMAMKKMLHNITKEISKAEVACLTTADDICGLHCSMQDDTTETLNPQKDLSMCTSGCMRSTRSEPVQVEKIGFFRRIFCPKKNTSHKEITIMSYLYTDSFDADRPLNDSDSLSEFSLN